MFSLNSELITLAKLSRQFCAWLLQPTSAIAFSLAVLDVIFLLILWSLLRADRDDVMYFHDVLRKYPRVLFALMLLLLLPTPFCLYFGLMLILIACLIPAYAIGLFLLFKL